MSNTLPSTALRRLLHGARYEVLPTASIAEKVFAHVPRTTTVTVTASPSKPLSTTLDMAAQFAAEGYDAVPHVAARMVSGRSELVDIVARLREAGVSKIFVPAGDAPDAAGDYAGSLDLLTDLHELDHPFEQIGVTGYPESHPSIADDVTIQSMWDKRKYATHVVSNMTFDAESIGVWTERMRRRGITQSVIVGVPGPVDPTKLLGMATKIGVGDSVRFLRKQKGVFARLAAPGFTADRFVSRVATLAANERLGIGGLHVYTFNQVEAVETWRQKMLEAAESVAR